MALPTTLRLRRQLSSRACRTGRTRTSSESSSYAVYRERYGEWPSECRLHPIGLQDVAHVLDAENFERLAAHLRLRTKDRMDVSVGGARGVVEYSKLDAGSIDEQFIKLAREWLGVNVRADLEHLG